LGQGRYTDCPFEINGTNTPTTGWVDDVSTDFALEFIGNHRDKSFALVVGYKSAHGPFQPPPRLADKYEGQTPRPTPNIGVPAIYSGKFSGGQVKADGSAKKKADNGEKSKADGQNMLRGYFGCLAAVDENVGRLLARLDELKLAENTVVIFASD